MLNFVHHYGTGIPLRESSIGRLRDLVYPSFQAVLYKLPELPHSVGRPSLLVSCRWGVGSWGDSHAMCHEIGAGKIP